jgi:autotransporter-associated beta strand protein
MQDLTVTKSGTGTLTIAGNADFTGPTTAQDGTLRVDGALAASHVTVEESATLAGTGSLPSATVRGTLALETDASLAITGTLALDDATLAIHGSPGASEPVILATHGGLTGEFAEITGVPDGWSLDTAHVGGTAIALVPDAPAGFAAWSATHLGGEGPDEDFHNDGIANLLRYALAIDATRPSGLPGSFTNGTLTFEKRPEAMAAGDVTYTILASPDLSPGSWFPIAADINNDYVISITPPVDGPGLFLRLAVQWSE